MDPWPAIYSACLCAKIVPGKPWNVCTVFDKFYNTSCIRLFQTTVNHPRWHQVNTVCDSCVHVQHIQATNLEVSLDITAASSWWRHRSVFRTTSHTRLWAISLGLLTHCDCTPLLSRDFLSRWMHVLPSHTLCFTRLAQLLPLGLLGRRGTRCVCAAVPRRTSLTHLCALRYHVIVAQ